MPPVFHKRTTGFSKGTQSLLQSARFAALGLASAQLGRNRHSQQGSCNRRRLLTRNSYFFEVRSCYRSVTATMGTLRSAADLIVSPASTPRPPLYVGMDGSMPISIEK